MSFGLILQRIPLLTWIFFALFVIASIVELVFAFLEMQKQRKAVKCFCLVFLSLSIFFFGSQAFLVGIAMVFALLGDFFLIFKKKRKLYFVIGTFFFFLGHLTNVACYIYLAKPLSPLEWLIPLNLCLLTIFGLWIPMRKTIHHQGMALGAVTYFTSIFADFLFALIAAIKGMTPYGFINVIGMVFFIASDAYIVKTMFKKGDKREDFYIMLTYLLAQGLVAAGFLFSIAYLGY